MERIRPPIGAAGLLRLCACALVACNAIAGIGVPILETSDGSATGLAPDGGTPVTDANGVQPVDSNTGEDAGPSGDVNVPDTAIDEDTGPGRDVNIPDANGPDTFTPPPPPSKPGFDLTAGGTYGKSASFSLIAVVGESPGGDNVGTSANFTLKAGVIAVTQPN